MAEFDLQSRLKCSKAFDSDCKSNLNSFHRFTSADMKGPFILYKRSHIALAKFKLL